MLKFQPVFQKSAKNSKGLLFDLPGLTVPTRYNFSFYVLNTHRIRTYLSQRSVTNDSLRYRYSCLLTFSCFIVFH